MLFLIDPTPDTLNYMLAGYAVLLGLPLLYLLSWFYRRSSLRRELEMLKTLQADKDAAGKPKKDQAQRV